MFIAERPRDAPQHPQNWISFGSDLITYWKFFEIRQVEQAEDSLEDWSVIVKMSKTDVKLFQY